MINKIKIFLLIFFILTLPSIAKAEPIVNQFAPDFSGVTSDGSNLNLVDLRGKTVILEWTNHECPFVKKHYLSGNIPNLQKQAISQGITWIQIISSAPGKQGYIDGETAKQLNRQRDAHPTYTLFDPSGAIGKLYAATNTPQLFIIDQKGILLYKGGIDSIPSADQSDIEKAENYISLALNELALGKAISKSSTRPYGCTIKYAD